LACPIIALDIPSGLMADTGDAPGAVVYATHTLSFIAHKPGLFTGKGSDVCGTISLHDLQIPKALYPAADGHSQTLAPTCLAQLLRKPDSHKGSYGTLAILGGASGMAGAALLAGRAALHLGTGKVILGLLDKVLSVDVQQAELMLHSANDALHYPALTLLAIGPGLGKSHEALELLKQSIAPPYRYYSMPTHSIFWPNRANYQPLCGSAHRPAFSRPTLPKPQGCCTPALKPYKPIE
ncbi:MAG: hypothetical protein K2Q15_11850, partial [Burkholderiales bacterium]|nr:hypothetical protein [Burkholderiales bacterium]